PDHRPPLAVERRILAVVLTRLLRREVMRAVVLDRDLPLRVGEVEVVLLALHLVPYPVVGPRLVVAGTEQEEPGRGLLRGIDPIACLRGRGTERPDTWGPQGSRLDADGLHGDAQAFAPSRRQGVDARDQLVGSEQPGQVQE